MKQHLTHIGLSILLIATCFSTIYAQPKGSIAKLDAFYTATSNDLSALTTFFHEKGSVHSITYDAEGQSVINVMQPDAYADELKKLADVYAIHQEPVVLVARSYGGLATYYYSVYTRLTHRGTRETALIKSIQTAHLVYDNDWHISHLSIQNENPYAPISDDLWPDALTKKIYADTLAAKAQNKGSDAVPYDPNKVYQVEDLDKAPAYPGDASLLQNLLDAFDIKSEPAEGYLPFGVVIEEDGKAQMGNTDGLTTTKKMEASNFISTMLIWYPGLKDKASVKSNLIFYIHE